MQQRGFNDEVKKTFQQLWSDPLTLDNLHAKACDFKVTARVEIGFVPLVHGDSAATAYPQKASPLAIARKEQPVLNDIAANNNCARGERLSMWRKQSEREIANALDKIKTVDRKHREVIFPIKMFRSFGLHPEMAKADPRLHELRQRGCIS